MTITRKKIALGVLTIGLLCSVLLVLILLGAQPYFHNFKTSESVKEHVRKTMHLNQSSLEDVQTVIDNRVFGQLDCTVPNKAMISCLALKEQFSWWYYALNFTFSNDVLVEFDVREVYRGL